MLHSSNNDLRLQARYSLIYDYLSADNLCDVRTPCVSGAQKNLFIADTEMGGVVFKFANPKLIEKNIAVANRFAENGIPVPDSKIHQYAGQSAEVYNAVPGRTLFEYLEQGVSEYKIFSIYQEILVYFEKMSHINWSDIDLYGFDNPCAIAKYQLQKTNSGALAKLTPVAVKCMNLGGKKDYGLYHHGITPKNIIVDENGKVTGFIDMDEVSVCNKNYAFGVLAAKASLYGIPTHKMCDMYENISRQKLNRTSVAITAGINNMGRKMLWKQTTKLHR